MKELESCSVDLFPYRYFSNGLVLAAQFPFGELAIFSDGIPDVYISLGDVPETLDNVLFEGKAYSASSNDFLLDIKNVARFLVKNQNEVIIQPYGNVEIGAIKIYILSTVLGVLLHKHEMLPLHACCVNINNQAVLISGHSGSGKSTLALGMHRKGYEVFNDDISSIFFDVNGKPYVHRGNMHIKLWAESLDKYGYNKEDFNRLKKDQEKFSFPLTPVADFAPVPLQAVFFLELNESENGIREEKLEGLSLFKHIRRHTFRYMLIDVLKKNESYFNLCNSLIGKASFLSVVRSKKLPPQALADYIENRVKSL